MRADQSSPPGPEDEAGARAGGTVVVRAGAGPQQPAGGVRRGDELDDLIERSFGPTMPERPGQFDAGLVVAGVALIAWWLVGGGSGPGLATGVVLVALGAALPARSLVLAANLRRRRHRDGG